MTHLPNELAAVGLGNKYFQGAGLTRNMGFSRLNPMVFVINTEEDPLRRWLIACVLYSWLIAKPFGEAETETKLTGLSLVVTNSDFLTRL